MPAIINTGSFGKALWPGVNKWYGDAYNEYPVEWTDIFTKNTSRKAFEEDISVSGFGLAVQKGEGQSVSYDGAQQGFVDRYQHAVYALGFFITKEMVEDDLYDVIGKKRAQALAFSMRQTKEIIAANILNRATTSGYTYGDGKVLCASDHPNVAGGTWSNIIGTAADLSEASLEQACIDIQGYTDDRGKRIAVRPQKLIVPYTLDFEANKIMRTEYEVGTNNNTVNLVRSRFPGGVKLNHYLTDTDAWFIITDVKDGLKYWERRGDSFDQDDDFDTDNAKFKASGRYSFGCTDKKSIYMSAGA
jgi:Mu-like prophage major head subunit gpT